ncbi:MAG TPA: hypothetical protein VMV18_05565, partial [bacterium]|nr:hypothetical protein [bacterium]
GGGKTITLDRFGDPTYMYYAASPTPGQVALDTTYDAALAGGPDIPAATWPGVLVLRHPITVPGTLPVPASGDLAISWTPVGADFVRFDFYNGFTPPALFSCWAKDDGSFAVPASFLATLPAGSGGVLAAATKRHTLLVNSRVVAFDGEASSGATWTK